MRFSSFFGFDKQNPKLLVAPAATEAQVPPTPARSSSSAPVSTPARNFSESLGATRTEIEIPQRTWLLPTQAAWVTDPWHLRIWEKSRQVGATKTDALDSVLKASPADARFDVWVSSRDEIQARLYLEDCVDWAKILHLGATYLGVMLLDPKTNFSAHVLQFANGRRIYCLSSNPNALAGKRGHVKLDEFALHDNQRLLYRIAKPVTQWGGTLSIISTHRGTDTLFNQFIQEIRHQGNPMGWHLFSYPIQKAVAEGIVERINEKSGRDESNAQFLSRTRAECSDEEQWLQEYCCTPADENSAFISYEMLNACTDQMLKLMSLDQLIAHCAASPSPGGEGRGEGGISPSRSAALYLGMDVARKTNLCVIDVGEKIGNVIHDRLRIELLNRPFSEIEDNLYRLLALPQLKRACIDASGIGIQLTERARERFGWKVEGITFSAALKEQLAFGLRNAFEDKKLRLVADEKLRADLHALKKETTSSGNIRFDGQFENSHCDRTWAKALRQHSARPRPSAGGAVA